MINWKVRIKNKTFWVSLVPAVLLLIQAVASLLGFQLDLSDMGDKLLAVVNTISWLSWALWLTQLLRVPMTAIR